MRLTLKAVEEKIDIDGEAYVMLTPSQAVHDKYQIEIKKGTKYGTDSKTVAFGDGVVTSDVYLVSLCLYKANARGELPRNDNGKPDYTQLIPLQTLNEWPRPAVKELVDLAKKLGGILTEPSTNGDGKAEGDDLKNSLETTAHGSS